MKKGEKVGKRQFECAEKQKSYLEVLAEYLIIAERKNLSSYTIYGYDYNGKKFAEWLGDKKITKNIMELYVDYLKSINTKDTSINSRIRKVQPILNFGYDHGYWEKISFIVVKEQEKIKETYTEKELELLLAHPKNNKFVEMRAWAIVWTFAATGIRRGELLNLKVSNVNLLERTILLNHTKNRKARFVPIASGLAEVMEEYLKLRGGEKDDYLFPTVYNNIMCTSTLNKELELYNARRGVASTGIHKFRHTFITNAVNQNVNVLTLKKITGHSSLEVLNGYYNAKTKDIVEVIDSIVPIKQAKKRKF